MKNELYNREPIKVVDDIPVFEYEDNYTQNYEQISDKLIDNMEQNGKNPFIEDYFWKEAEALTIDFLKKYSRKSDKVLDIGVGLGETISSVVDIDKYGIDITLRQLHISKQKGIEVAFAKAENLPYNDEVFDIILCTDVLEHVIDLNAAVKEMERVLKTGGHAVIRVPYKEDLKDYLDTKYEYEFAHLRNFDLHSLRLLMEKVGRFKYVESKGVNYYLIANRIKFSLPLKRHFAYLARRLRKHTRNIENTIARKICNPIEMIFIFTKK